MAAIGEIGGFEALSGPHTPGTLAHIGNASIENVGDTLDTLNVQFSRLDDRLNVEQTICQVDLGVGLEPGESVGFGCANEYSEDGVIDACNDCGITATGFPAELAALEYNLPSVEQVLWFGYRTWGPNESMPSFTNNVSPKVAVWPVGVGVEPPAQALNDRSSLAVIAAGLAPITIRELWRALR